MSAPQASKFDIDPLFATPTVFAHMKDSEQLNADLEALFEKIEAEGDKYANPEPFVVRNKTLYESNFTLFEWKQQCVQDLKAFCLSNLYRAIQELNGYDVHTLRRMHVATESWFHVTHKGGFFGAHNHALHSWSGVYCVRHDGDDPQSNSGRLTFINPNAMSTMYMDTAVSNMKSPYAYSNRRLRLEPGQLVLFPSWLLHEVMPYEGDTKRITVAFNARFRMSGVQPADVPRA